MLRKMALICGGLILSLSLTGGSPVQAQDGVLDQMYGSGVHAYFAGDYFGAHDYLTSAIDAGSKDPRVYYFRALAYHRLGRSKDAEADLATGADLEMANADGSPAVSRALVRIQGNDRRTIERRRRDARMAALQRSNQLRNNRFGGRAREEIPQPARRGPVLPPAADRPEPDLFVEPEPGEAEPAPAPAEPAPMDPEPAPVDPEPTDPAPVPGEPAPDAAPPSEPAPEDPFGDDPAPAEEEAPADDPFGDDDPFG